MSLLIDGYNLLYALGIVGAGEGPGGLERSRVALLNFLVETLAPDEVARTTVVFDASNAPPGLPRTVTHRGLTVRFASGYEDADALIEELIRAESAPRRLTVVSSDHRLQRAARRRRAQPLDCDRWYADVIRRRATRRQARSTPAEPGKPAVPLLEEEVAQWIERFGGEKQLDDLIQEELGAKTSKQKDSPKDPTPPAELPAIDNPFPPGYGEDLLEDEWEDEASPFPPEYGEGIDEV